MAMGKPQKIGRGVKLGKLIFFNDGLSSVWVHCHVDGSGWYIIYEVLFVGSALELVAAFLPQFFWV